jgi:glycosyltransferase involved in cell wall biosynthesis
MKIIIFGGYLNGETGDTNVVKTLSKFYSKTNDVYLFPNLPLIQKLSNYDGITTIKKDLSFYVFKYSFLNFFKWFKIVFKFLKKNSLKNLAYYFITLYNKSHMQKSIEMINPDIIHVNGLSLDYLPIVESAIENNIPLLLTTHGKVLKIPNLYFKPEIEGYLLERTLNYKRASVTAISSSVKDYLVQTYGADPEDIKLVLNGVNVERFGYKNEEDTLRKLKGITKDKTVLIQVGTLNILKNHIEVLKAIKEMDLNIRKDLLYLIIGDGPEKKNLMDYCKTNDLDSYVKFVGKIPNTEVNDWYNLSDFFILPSISEGLPLVFLEAMACGLPIITFKDLEGVSDIYSPDYMELVVDRSTESLINSLRTVLSKDWDKNKIAKNAEKWDWETISKEYLEIYKETISKS